MILIVSLYCEFRKLEKGVSGGRKGSPPKTMLKSLPCTGRARWPEGTLITLFKARLLYDVLNRRSFKSLAQKTACSTGWKGISKLGWDLMASKPKAKMVFACLPWRSEMVLLHSLFMFRSSFRSPPFVPNSSYISFALTKSSCKLKRTPPSSLRPLMISPRNTAFCVFGRKS